MGCGAPAVLWCAFVKCSTRHPNSSWQCCKWQRGKMQFIYPTSTWAPANSKVEGTYLVQSVACAWLHSIREKEKLLLQLGFFTRGAVAAQFSAWSTWSENQNHNFKRGTAVGFFSVRFRSTSKRNGTGENLYISDQLQSGGSKTCEQNVAGRYKNVLMQSYRVINGILYSRSKWYV